MNAAKREPVLWDILEEHLDEAGFLGAQWERGLDSPAIDLAGLASGVERRLCAHLDALLLAGPRAAEKLLLPAMHGDDPEPCFAAALVLLASPAPEHAAAVFTAWSKSSATRRALTRALTVAPSAPHRPELHATLTADDATLRAAAIDVLSFHRALRSQDLAPHRGDDHPAVREALVRAAGRDPGLDLHALVRDELGQDSPTRLAAALTSAAILGLPDLPAACRRALARPDPAGELALLLTALTSADLTPLLAARSKPAVYALGFTGGFAAAEACVQCIRDDHHPAIALEALTALTGAALPHRAPPDDDALPDLADDDLTADIASGPEDDLPLPDRDAVLAWWHDHRDRLARAPLPGHAIDRRAILAALARASMRRRHALALRLAIVTGGQAQLETRASARHQLAAMARLGAA